MTLSGGLRCLRSLRALRATVAGSRVVPAGFVAARARRRRPLVTIARDLIDDGAPAADAALIRTAEPGTVAVARLVEAGGDRRARGRRRSRLQPPRVRRADELRDPAVLEGVAAMSLRRRRASRTGYRLGGWAGRGAPRSVAHVGSRRIGRRPIRVGRSCQVAGNTAAACLGGGCGAQRHYEDTK